MYCSFCPLSHSLLPHHRHHPSQQRRQRLCHRMITMMVYNHQYLYQRLQLDEQLDVAFRIRATSNTTQTQTIVLVAVGAGAIHQILSQTPSQTPSQIPSLLPWLRGLCPRRSCLPSFPCPWGRRWPCCSFGCLSLTGIHPNTHPLNLPHPLDIPNTHSVDLTLVHSSPTRSLITHSLSFSCTLLFLGVLIRPIYMS